ncbi:hypothetical protein [Pseudazoarcus pumilus]|uniref:Uncharacterized protein n=1 Tax=Pseudazoarcus pumilus TaxID=2067960 RepID=A0A2I6S3E8_9RHOO|nr:hypothetical protein [Pseudazoarcus pumilus]AUN93758.1 hypothetical protein C0099_01680 [Pseudazoarcus pumilus]
MKLADGIRKLGFIRWHERELLLGHGWLALALLVAVMCFTALELTFDAAGGALARIFGGLAFTLLALLTVHLLNRFFVHLVAAQRASAQAICPHCATFGRLILIGEDFGLGRVRVRCRKCATEWAMDTR